MTLKCSYSPFRKRCFTIIIIAIAFVFGSEGCKITYSLTGASISPDVKTISIQYFQNRASLVQPALSQYITDHLISKCKSQTNLSFISGAGDVNFDGEITDYNTVPLTVSGNEQAAMNRFTISVKVKFTNIVQPEMSYDQVFSRYEDYDSSKDLSQVEQQLSEKIVEMIVEDIFNKAFANW
jgi:hypothetical protein